MEPSRGLAFLGRMYHRRQFRVDVPRWLLEFLKNGSGGFTTSSSCLLTQNSLPKAWQLDQDQDHTKPQLDPPITVPILIPPKPVKQLPEPLILLLFLPRTR